MVRIDENVHAATQAIDRAAEAREARSDRALPIAAFWNGIVEQAGLTAGRLTPVGRVVDSHTGTFPAELHSLATTSVDVVRADRDGTTRDESR
jgi:hypothetical protein